jgi:hypothetical protein
MNLVDAWLYVFWKENNTDLRVFQKKKIFLQFYINFIISSYSTTEFLDQFEIILGFLMYPLHECHSWDTVINPLFFLEAR